MLIENEFMTTFDISKVYPTLSRNESGLYKLFGSKISYDNAKSIIKSAIDSIREMGGVK